MEIQTSKIPWGKWYVQILGLILLKWILNLFTFKLKMMVNLLLTLLLILAIGWNIFKFIEWINSKMLNKEFK